MRRIRLTVKDLLPCFIVKQSLQTQQGPVHVFTVSICLFFGLSSELTFTIESSRASQGDFFGKVKAGELFTKGLR